MSTSDDVEVAQDKRESLLENLKTATSKFFDRFRPLQSSETSNDVSTCGNETNTNSADLPPTFTVTEEDIDEYLSRETGRQRLKDMFNTSIYQNEAHPDLYRVLYTTYCSSLMVFLLMAGAGARSARLKFVAKNLQRKWDTRFLASRAYNDAIFMASFKVGGQWGLRTVALVGMVMMTSQTISTYRNKTSPLEFAVGGAVSCSLMKFSLGPKGMFAGGAIGSLLGLTAGCMYSLAAHACSWTQAEDHREFLRKKLRLDKEIQYQMTLIGPGEEETSETDPQKDSS